LVARCQWAGVEPYCLVHIPQRSDPNPTSDPKIVTTGLTVPKSFTMMSLREPEKPDSLSQ